MKPIIKLNNYDIDILITEDFAKDLRIGDVLCVFSFEKNEKAEWVIDFISYYDETYDNIAVMFPIDEEYREEEGYFKLKITEREFRGNELIFWCDVHSNDKDYQWK